jgi:hypothetical protein
VEKLLASSTGFYFNLKLLLPFWRHGRQGRVWRSMGFFLFSNKNPDELNKKSLKRKLNLSFRTVNKKNGTKHFWCRFNSNVQCFFLFVAQHTYTRTPNAGRCSDRWCRREMVWKLCSIRWILTLNRTRCCWMWMRFGEMNFSIIVCWMPKTI